MKKLFCFYCLLFAAVLPKAQSLPVPRNIAAAYAKGTRSTNGKPGKAYWQNRATYKIALNFNPVTRLVRGVVDVAYVNNSPDTLRQIWYKLYPNLYKSGTPRRAEVSPGDLGPGLIIDSMWVNGQVADKAGIGTDGTNMTVNRQSLMAGGILHSRIVYHYTLNKTSHIRTGEVEPGAAFIAYFFPRIAVYDDIDGWNRHPYDGRLEFYNDFCDFDVNITVPKNTVVWATGDLQNCAEVFSPAICQRIAQAEKGDAIVNVIDAADDKRSITAARPFNTWHYTAANVTDFAFAVSDHYLWQSTSLVVDPATGRRTRVDAVFNPKHKDYYWVIGDARKTVEGMSYYFPQWPYPYNHETVFDGLDQMEYPMMVNDNPVETREQSITLTDHEIFHTMFPFYMGINETKYAWMDEGWATIGEWLLSGYIDSSIADAYGVAPTEKQMGAEADSPVMTLSTETAAAYFTNSYPEPAMGYLYARDLLGDSLFRKGLHYYISQWNGRHPMPLDFFNCMNTGSGKNLNWFWKRWFYDGGFADLTITAVNKRPDGYAVLVSAKGTKPVPVDLTITYDDGTTAKAHRSVAVWENGEPSVEVALATARQIKKIVLGSTWVPDADKSDNVYTVK